MCDPRAMPMPSMFSRLTLCGTDQKQKIDDLCKLLNSSEQKITAEVLVKGLKLDERHAVALKESEYPVSKPGVATYFPLPLNRG